MRLERGMITSREGLISNGTALGVTSDNIANLNTDGFKSSRARFSDMFAYANDENENIAQPGGGVQVSDVQQNHSQGSVEFTQRELDFAIDGNGFFMTGTDENDFQLTRNGSFNLDNEGFLVDQNGNRVLGLQEGSEVLGQIDMLEVENGAAETNNFNISGNLDSRLEAADIPTDFDNFNELQSTASFSSTATVFDSLGNERDIQLYYFKNETEAGQGSSWDVRAYTDAEQLGGDPLTPQLLGQTTLQFDQFGVLEEDAEASAINFDAAWDGANNSNINIDLSGLGQVATGSTISNFERDGQSAGRLESYDFGENGEIFGRLTSGQLIQIGTLQIGSVANVNGLDRQGANNFQVSNASGEIDFGDPNSGNRGTLRSGALEKSNVDMATEFVDLTQKQASYSANSQVLTSLNDLYQSTIQLIS